MKTESVLMAYYNYYRKIGDRESLYRAVVNRFKCQSALYPGSHIDITPSLLIPKVTYVDNFKGTARFFKQRETILEFIEAHKYYTEACQMSYHNHDFQLIGIVTQNYEVVEKNLDKYFMLPEGEQFDLALVMSQMKGLGYLHRADNYILGK